MNGIELYDKVRSVPQIAMKSFNNGSFSGTDINPMWRIKTLVEQFGMCGVGWYYEVLSERSEVLDDSTTIAIVDVNLYVKVDGEWSKPIFGTGGNKLRYNTAKKGIVTSDEGYKMALTDALSVACKALGIGADVYFSADKTKYTQYETPVEKPVEKTNDAVPKQPVCENCMKTIVDYNTERIQFDAPAIVIMSRQHYGKQLCWSCMMAEKAKRKDAGK